MLARVEKARSREAVLLARQTAAVAQSWAQFVQGARAAPGVTTALARRDVEAALRALDRPIQAFASGWVAAFIDAGNLTTAHLSRKLIRKATPTVGLSFDVTDPRAVELMRRNRLALVTNLTRQQRGLIRPVLVRGIQQGLGPVAVARQLRTLVGLTDQGERAIRIFEQSMRSAQREEMQLPEDERGPTLNDDQIADRVDRLADQWRRIRAEAIARTESTRIVSMAGEEALRQSIEATGIKRALVGREWRSTHDGRTREAHADADGQRRRLDEPFEIGGESIMAPGMGSARNSVHCRCVLITEFFDTEQELQAWLVGGS